MILSLSQLAKEEYCYLTTTGRVSGKPHEIEIWFALQNTMLYLLSGGGDKADWVKNLRVNPTVTIRVAKRTFTAQARIVSDQPEEMIARNLLADKYKEREADGSLDEWARTALPVAIDLSQGESS